MGLDPHQRRDAFNSLARGVQLACLDEVEGHQAEAGTVLS
jgi:hypothetical protein